MLLRKRNRLAVLVAVLLLGTLLVASPADAAPENKDGDSTDHQNDGDTVIVRAGSRRRAVERGAEEGTTSDGCNWTVYVGDDLAQPIFENRVDVWDDSSPIFVPDPEYASDRLFSETGRWFQAIGCTDPARSGVYAEGDAISLPELVGEAWGLLDPPRPTTIGSSPPNDEPDRFPVVRIPTWFWVDEPYRSTIFTARANYPAAGPIRVWAEANARPETTEWSPGDGTGWLDCPALGTIRVDGMSEDDTACSHTYTRSSVLEGDGVYDVEGRIWFETWWESSLGGTQTGPLPSLNRETIPIAFEVGEIQSVER